MKFVNLCMILVYIQFDGRKHCKVCKQKKEDWYHHRYKCPYKKENIRKIKKRKVNLILIL